MTNLWITFDLERKKNGHFFSLNNLPYSYWITEHLPPSPALLRGLLEHPADALTDPDSPSV